MKRKDFLKLTVLLPFSGTLMNLDTLNAIANTLGNSPKMPVLFLGHGSPMNAIEENEFVAGFRNISKSIPTPKAILCISAHWETKGTFITAMANPKTIHDFGGFPKALYEIQYPAPGSPKLAKDISSSIKKTRVELDYSWGLDHGAWSVIKHLYPNYDVPVMQLSIDYTKPAVYHYELAKELNFLRHKGVLIIGSGNLVHNLQKVAWNKLEVDDYSYDWALEASSKMKDLIITGNHKSMINYKDLGKVFELAIPTPEHYLPAIYSLGLQNKNEEIFIFNDKAVGGSLTMTSFRIG